MEKKILAVFGYIEHEKSGCTSLAECLHILNKGGGDRAHKEIAECCLADHEVRGFIAEISTFSSADDDTDDVLSKKMNFVEHVKQWVPTIFELRKARYYTMLFEAHEREEIELVDLSHYEIEFPLDPRPGNMAHKFDGPAGSNQHSRSSFRRRSFTGIPQAIETSQKGSRGHRNSIAPRARRNTVANLGEMGGNRNFLGSPGSRGSQKLKPKGMPKRRAGAKLCRRDSFESVGSLGSK